MRRLWLALGFACLASAASGAGASERRAAVEALATEPLSASKKPLSDDQVRRILIDESIADYLANVGNCPCPYHRARNGSRCGRRSAYDRAGGEAPLCFPKDVSDQMVQQYRESRAD